MLPWFTKYAILDDDVVIIDKRVAQVYMSLLKEIDVGISVGKSLISPTGSAEFAKRFRIRNFPIYLSPFSVRSIVRGLDPGLTS